MSAPRLAALAVATSLPRIAIHNEMLRDLPPAELSHLRPHLTPATLVASQVLQEAGVPVHDVFFLESGLTFVTADAGGSGPVEVGAIGRDGFVGLPALLSSEPISAHRVFVQVPGRAYRIQAGELRRMTETLPTLRDRCLRYVQVMLMQTSQVAACNARHEIPGRLARWLLTNRDRLDRSDLPITQELLSTLLGVRRAGISVAVSRMAMQGLVRQSPGRITILDHTRLENVACACRSVICQSQAAIMGRPLHGSDNRARVRTEKGRGA